MIEQHGFIIENGKLNPFRIYVFLYMFAGNIKLYRMLVDVPFPITAPNSSRKFQRLTSISFEEFNNKLISGFSND